MKRLFRGGTVVSGDGLKKMDVLVKGEKILAMGEDPEFKDAEIVDVTGKLLFPGFIDLHTHMDLEVSGTVTADGFDTGTKAEIAGGTSCIIDFATQKKCESLSFALQHWHEKADGKCSCDYGFHMSISDWNPSVSRELDDMMEEGITSFKLYMTYDTQVDDKTIFEILRRLKEVGGITGYSEEEKQKLADRKNRYYLEMIESIDGSEILPGIPEFLEKLKNKGYQTALGSASKSGRMILEKLGLDSKFDVIVDGNLVERPKPDPEVFVKAAQLLGVPCEECIVVEDAQAGVQAAHAGGMKCIGIGDERILGEAEKVVSDTEELNRVDLERL